MTDELRYRLNHMADFQEAFSALFGEGLENRELDFYLTSGTTVRGKVVYWPAMPDAIFCVVAEGRRRHLLNLTQIAGVGEVVPGRTVSY